MKTSYIKALSFLMMSSAIISCCHSGKISQKAAATGIPGPHAIIYQTRNDYSQLVPINLTADKKSVESYPDVKDVYFGGKLALPTQLHDGWLLDNRGISPNSAFISLTYEQYSKLEKTPAAEELLRMVIDKDPVTKIFDCGLRTDYKDVVNELNRHIDEKSFSGFKTLK